ncbi:AMP-binding protein [Zymobacter palmae]|uniref:AMP-binding protein n=1 Tax=Zymobacter palmae TaxID=33074 RepID=UPI0022B26DCC|nr:AMP-binding protein [Zymobacter palmae]
MWLAVLPIAHNFPLACPGVLGTLSQGGRVVLSDTASCDEAMPLIASERVSHVALVPALARLWQQAREWEDSDLSSLNVMQVGGAPLDPRSAQALSRTFACTLQQVFGMAEGLLCYTRLDDDDETCQSTQGRPLSCHDEIRIVDEQERPVPTGDIGQLLTRGPYTITGYYRAPAASAQSFTADGFYRTGDLACCDKHGNVRVEGRLKEQINRAGEKIAATSVETGLKQLPGIEDAVVVAVPDALLGERICAVLMTSASQPSLPELRHALIECGLSRHSLPDQLMVVTHWPLTAVGKIDRQALIRQATVTPPESAA